MPDNPSMSVVHRLHLPGCQVERPHADTDIAERQRRRLRDLVRVRSQMAGTVKAGGPRKLDVELITPGRTALRYDAREVMLAMADALASVGLLTGEGFDAVQWGRVRSRTGTRQESGVVLTLTEVPA